MKAMYQKMKNGKFDGRDNTDIEGNFEKNTKISDWDLLKL